MVPAVVLDGLGGGAWQLQGARLSVGHQPGALYAVYMSELLGLGTGSIMIELQGGNAPQLQGASCIAGHQRDVLFAAPNVRISAPLLPRWWWQFLACGFLLRHSQRASASGSRPQDGLTVLRQAAAYADIRCRHRTLSAHSPRAAFTVLLSHLSCSGTGSMGYPQGDPPPFAGAAAECTAAGQRRHDQRSRRRQRGCRCAACSGAGGRRSAAEEWPVWAGL